MKCPLTSPFENIPVELRRSDQWVVWKIEERTGKDKKPVKAKVPYSARTGEKASTKDPDTWSSYEKAICAVRNFGMDGIGFVFTENDPYVGIDLDNAIHEDGTIGLDQGKLVERLDSYTETSQSGSGLHIIVKGETPGGQALKKGDAFGPGHGLEIYETGRYFIMTGNRLESFPEDINEDAGTLDALFRQFKSEVETVSPAVCSSEAVLLQDGEIIEKAKSAKNGEKFQKLWNGDCSDYSSQSEADEALCCLLAFWTKDPGQIDRMFRSSGLVRPKWDERHGRETYGEMTINNALQLVTKGYQKLASTAVEHALTDLGNADRFASDWKQKLKYCRNLGGWHHWDGIRWRKDETGKAVRLAKDTVRRIFIEAAEQTDPEKRKQIAKHAMASQNRARVVALLEMAESELAFTTRELDVATILLNCENGLLDLRTGKLHPHSPDHMVSKVTGATYRPDINPSGLWSQFLNDIFNGNTGLIRFVQKAVGYSLTGETTEQCLFILYGEGANGKSTFLEAVGYALGDYAATASPETFLLTKNHKNIGDDIAALKGSRFVATSETARGRQWDESRVKHLTGGDTLTCRKLYGDYFDYKPTWKIWMATNHKPHFDTDNEALFRRIRLIPFTVAIPLEKQDKNLLEKLRVHAPEILAWAVEGALLWQNEGLESPAAVLFATDGYRREQDSLGRFLDEECIKGEGREVKISAFKSRYEEWCDETGERKMPRGQIGRYLLKQGIEKHRTKEARYFQGVGLRTDDTGDGDDGVS